MICFVTSLLNIYQNLMSLKPSNKIPPLLHENALQTSCKRRCHVACKIILCIYLIDCFIARKFRLVEHSYVIGGK
jgi:hypothetical protein